MAAAFIGPPIAFPLSTLLNFPAPGAATYTSSIDLVESCVFDKTVAWAYSLRLTYVSTPFS